MLYTNPAFLYPNFGSGVNTCQVLVVAGTLSGRRRIQVFVNQANFEESCGTSVINAAESIVRLITDLVLLELLAQRPDLRGLSAEWFFRVVTAEAGFNHVTRVIPVLDLPSPGRWSRLSLALRGRPRCEVETVRFDGWARVDELLFADLPDALEGPLLRALPGQGV